MTTPAILVVQVTFAHAYPIDEVRSWYPGETLTDAELLTRLQEDVEEDALSVIEDASNCNVATFKLEMAK